MHYGDDFIGRISQILIPFMCSDKMQHRRLFVKLSDKKLNLFHITYLGFPLCFNV